MPDVQPLRIAMLSVHTSPLAKLGGKEAGGMNVYVRELSLQLGQMGIGVDIFTRSQAPTIPMVTQIAPNVRVITLPAGATAPYDKYELLNHLPAFVERVCAFAQEQQGGYDLIHSHYWISGAVALMLRERWHVPIIQMFHTLGAMKNRVSRSAEESETDQRMDIERHLLHTVDAVVAATPLDRDQMLQHYAADPSRITVIPGGVNQQQFYPMPQRQARAELSIPDDHLVAVCIGRMEPLKGMDYLIQAFGLLGEHYPAWRERLQLLLIGGEPEHDVAYAQWNTEQRRLAALRETLGITPIVRFLGGQPHDMLPLYYSAADVCVVPSLYESFGLVALEAQACGCCVVASDVGGLQYTVAHQQSGLLVPPGDPHALAAALGSLFADSAYRVMLGAAAAERAGEFGWSRIAERMVSHYHALCQH
jgi:D-inositol-3-phosphate glycosyltransferase